MKVEKNNKKQYVNNMFVYGVYVLILFTCCCTYFLQSLRRNLQMRFVNSLNKPRYFKPECSIAEDIVNGEYIYSWNKRQIHLCVILGVELLASSICKFIVLRMCENGGRPVL